MKMTEKELRHLIRESIIRTVLKEGFDDDDNWTDDDAEFNSDEPDFDSLKINDEPEEEIVADQPKRKYNKQWETIKAFLDGKIRFSELSAQAKPKAKVLNSAIKAGDWRYNSSMSAAELKELYPQVKAIRDANAGLDLAGDFGDPYNQWDFSSYGAGF